LRDFDFVYKLAKSGANEARLYTNAGNAERATAGEGLAGSAAAGAEALDLPSLGGRHVVRSPAHLTHEPLLLHLAPELAESLLELLGILDDYSHDATGYRRND
jgi:hypothetical protein